MEIACAISSSHGSRRSVGGTEAVRVVVSRDSVQRLVASALFLAESRRACAPCQSTDSRSTTAAASASRSVSATRHAVGQLDDRPARRQSRGAGGGPPRDKRQLFIGVVEFEPADDEHALLFGE